MTGHKKYIQFSGKMVQSTNFFDQISKMREILTKKPVFPLKVSHLQLNYALLLF